MADDPVAKAEAALAGGLVDALDVAARALGVGPGPNRAQRRAKGGSGAGRGKHPLGATKPLQAERVAARRRRERSR